MHEFPVTALRSVDIDVPNLTTAERFYTEAWGLTVAARAPGAVYFRGTGDDHHILALHEGGAVAMRSITFRAADRAALDHVAAEAVRQGGRLLQPPGPVDWMGGGVGTVIADRRDRTLRVVHGDARHTPEAPAQDRPARLAHVNVNSTATDAAAAFFNAVLGFRLTDRSKLMAFVRCPRPGAVAHDRCGVVGEDAGQGQFARAIDYLPESAAGRSRAGPWSPIRGYGDPRLERWSSLIARLVCKSYVMDHHPAQQQCKDRRQPDARRPAGRRRSRLTRWCGSGLGPRRGIQSPTAAYSSRSYSWAWQRLAGGYRISC